MGRLIAKSKATLLRNASSKLADSVISISNTNFRAYAYYCKYATNSRISLKWLYLLANQLARIGTSLSMLSD